jgi:hypothetical protein
VSDKDLEDALEEANVRPDVADDIVAENADARINGLRAALAVLGLLALVAFVAARRLPTAQAGSSPPEESIDDAEERDRSA